MNPPRNNLPVKVDRLRVLVRKIFILIALGVTGILAFFAVGIVLLSTGKVEKNIILIPPILDGKIDSFVFASIAMDGKGNSTLVVLPVSSSLHLTPLTQILTKDSQTARLQRAQASVQTGVLIDEVWSVAQLPPTITKQVFMETWKQELEGRFSREWWQARWLLSEHDVQVKEAQERTNLAEESQVARISPSARQCSVAIVNTTKVPGLASAVSDYLEKIGLVVIRVTDNQANSANSHLVIADKSSEVCKEAIAVLDYISPQPLELVEDPEAANTYRAALVLLVGQNMIQVQEPTQ